MNQQKEIIPVYGKTIFTIIVIALVFIGGFAIVNMSKVTIEKNSLKVAGMHGADIKYEDIKKLELKDSLPNNLRRVNGLDLIGKAYIGNFKTDDMNKLKLFVKSTKGPFIYMSTNDEYLIINEKNKQDTKELFDKLSSEVDK
jgi:predicted MPP superfamily phosphohydrolase